MFSTPVGLWRKYWSKLIYFYNPCPFAFYKFYKSCFIYATVGVSFSDAHEYVYLSWMLDNYYGLCLTYNFKSVSIFFIGIILPAVATKATHLRITNDILNVIFDSILNNKGCNAPKNRNYQKESTNCTRNLLYMAICFFSFVLNNSNSLNEYM